VLDPDGYRVVIAYRAAGAAEPERIEWHDGDRAELRALFELAEDSAAQLADYFDQGRVLVARRGDTIIGHLQLVPTDADGDIELKNMAVRPAHQGTGVGRALVTEAVRRAQRDGYGRMTVATAAADTGNIRFYQRAGFRMCSVEPDAFTPETGYPDPILIDGIELRDRVWFARSLRDEQDT
jgi:GNAT superfamily N-acetyltransferase